jgi:hypothetical protein
MQRNGVGRKGDVGDGPFSTTSTSVAMMASVAKSPSGINWFSDIAFAA